LKKEKEWEKDDEVERKTGKTEKKEKEEKEIEGRRW